MAERFDQFQMDVIRGSFQNNSLTLHYKFLHPENFGIQKPNPPSYGTLSGDADEAEISGGLEALRQIDRHQLREDQRLTYDVLESLLETNQMAEGLSLYGEPLSPMGGVHSSLPVYLAEYSFSSPSDAEEYLALLGRTGEYFQGLFLLEQKKAEQGLLMPKYALDQTVQQCLAFSQAAPEENVLIESFLERLNSGIQIEQQEKEALIEKNKEAVQNVVLPAYQKLAEDLSGLSDFCRQDGGLCTLPEGKRYYEYLVQSNVASRYTIPVMAQLLDEDIKRNWEQIQKTIQEKPELIEQYNAMTYPNQDIEGMLTQLKEWLPSHFPADGLDQIQYEIKNVAPSLQDTSRSAFYMFPPADAGAGELAHVIYINPGKKNEKSNLLVTLAHEGFPGHLYQFEYFIRTNPPVLRRLLNFSGFLEGWSTYIEQYAYSLTEYQNPELMELKRLRSLNFLELYARVDIGVNAEGWSREQAAEYLKKYGVSSESSIQGYYQLAVLAPTANLPYTIGYFEFRRLREEAQEKMGAAFQEEIFHQTILETGPVPFSILYREAAGKLWGEAEEGES